MDLAVRCVPLEPAPWAAGLTSARTAGSAVGLLPASFLGEKFASQDLGVQPQSLRPSVSLVTPGDKLPPRALAGAVKAVGLPA